MNVRRIASESKSGRGGSKMEEKSKEEEGEDKERERRRREERSSMYSSIYSAVHKTVKYHHRMTSESPRSKLSQEMPP